MKKYKVCFHRGHELTLKTRAMKGHAWVDQEGLHVRGVVDTISIPRRDLKAVEMFRLHGLGRVIRVDHDQGRLFVTVVRFMIGQFALINFFATGTMKNQLTDLIKQPS
jgi:hypothetical protein